LNFIKFWNPVSDFFVLKMSNTSLSLWNIIFILLFLAVLFYNFQFLFS
jgi:hypothetical protein